jgi:hypothetical protein
MDDERKPEEMPAGYGKTHLRVEVERRDERSKRLLEERVEELKKPGTPQCCGANGGSARWLRVTGLPGGEISLRIAHLIGVEQPEFGSDRLYSVAGRCQVQPELCGCVITRIDGVLFYIRDKYADVMEALIRETGEVPV